jgi:hypothetical protein
LVSDGTLFAERFRHTSSMVVLPSLANEKGLQALWSYEQLINDTSHYEGLIERDPTALRHFYEEECMRRRCV